MFVSGQFRCYPGSADDAEAQVATTWLLLPPKGRGAMSTLPISLPGPWLVPLLGTEVPQGVRRELVLHAWWSPCAPGKESPGFVPCTSGRPESPQLKW